MANTVIEKTVFPIGSGVRTCVFGISTSAFFNRSRRPLYQCPTGIITIIAVKAKIVNKAICFRP